VTNAWQARPSGAGYEVQVFAGSTGEHHAAVWISYWRISDTAVLPKPGWYELSVGGSSAEIVAGTQATATVRNELGAEATFNFQTDTWE
jgi:hypothetical protein